MLRLALTILLVGLNSDHRSLINTGRYDEALIISKFCRFNGEFFFYQAVANFKLKQYKEAKRNIEQAFFYNLPERYYVVLTALLNEITLIGERNDPMLDISTDMDLVVNRLGNAKAGEKTQEIQRRILAKLDKEIQSIEDEMNKAKQQSESSQGSPQQARKESGIIEEAPPKGDLSNKKLILDGKTWGNLPPKERIKTIENITRTLPPHIREASENFSKIINNKPK